MSVQRQRIDWVQVRDRLRASQQALEKALTGSPERLEATYRERAARLARRRDAATPGATLRVLVFALGRERYALEFADLSAVLPFAGCAPVPNGPPGLLGVANIDGDIRSVLDLGRLLELPAAESAPAGYILVLRRQGQQTALRVDAIDEIRQIAPGELAGPGADAAEPGVRFLRGWTPDRLKLLNTEALLAHPIFQGTP